MKTKTGKAALEAKMNAKAAEEERKAGMQFSVGGSPYGTVPGAGGQAITYDQTASIADMSGGSGKTDEEQAYWEKDGSAANDSANYMHDLGVPPEVMSQIVKEDGTIDYDAYREWQALEQYKGYGEQADAERKDAQAAHDRAVGKDLVDAQARAAKLGWGGGGAMRAHAADVKSQADFDLNKALNEISRNEYMANQSAAALGADLFADLDKKAADEAANKLLEGYLGGGDDEPADNSTGAVFPEDDTYTASEQAKDKTGGNNPTGEKDPVTGLTLQQAHDRAVRNRKESYTWKGTTYYIKGSHGVGGASS